VSWHLYIRQSYLPRHCGRHIRFHALNIKLRAIRPRLGNLAQFFAAFTKGGIGFSPGGAGDCGCNEEEEGEGLETHVDIDVILVVAGTGGCRRGRMV
jgi:hypothetical protein